MSPPDRSYPAIATGRVMDLVGAALLLASAVWTVVCSLGRPEARPGPQLALSVGALVAFVLGRWSASRNAALLPRAVAVGVSGAVVLGFPDVLRAGGGPTGYGNANSALVALGCIAAVTVASGSREPAARRGWFALALGLAGVVVATSVAVTLLLVLVAGLAVLSALGRSGSVALIGGGLALAVTLGTTSAIAAGGDPVGLGTRADVRADLWQGALDLLREEPVAGIGPGGYERASPYSSDRDFRWAHHEYLQQGAEQGILGALLLVGLVAWGYARLSVAATGAARASALAGAAALTVVAVHSTVDHSLHHPPVTLTMIALVGWATQRPGFIGLSQPVLPGPPRSDTAPAGGSA